MTAANDAAAKRTIDYLGFALEDVQESLERALDALGEFDTSTHKLEGSTLNECLLQLEYDIKELREACNDPH